METGLVYKSYHKINKQSTFPLAIGAGDLVAMISAFQALMQRKPNTWVQIPAGAFQYSKRKLF